MEGLKALIAAIKELPKLSSLKCANRVPYLILPILGKCDIGLWHTHLLTADSSGHSLDDNRLCGVSKWADGTYTTEGITALCEGIKQSNIQSLR